MTKVVPYLKRSMKNIKNSMHIHNNSVFHYLAVGLVIYSRPQHSKLKAKAKSSRPRPSPRPETPKAKAKD